MPDTSPNLALPYLLPAQAQKHVTHNEALARLDAIVQLVVQAFEALTPPPAPAAGEIHALGPVPAGVWDGQGGKLALWDGTAWAFVAPRPGWRAWGLAEGALRIWRGTAWEPLPFDNLAGLGVGTAHDATNRLAVAAPATLLTHAGAGHQVKVNKAAAADTASLLFQDGWSGRAEIGLAGSDDFSLKVSPDGGAWAEALLADRSTGRLRLPGGARLPNGSAASPALAFDASPATGVFRPAADQIGFATAGVQRALLSGSALQIDLPLTGTAVSQSATDTTAGRVLRTGYGGLGTAITLTAADNLDNIAFSGVYFNSTGGNTPGNNYPLASAGALLSLYRSSTNRSQIYFAYGGASVHFRSYGAAGWSGWSEICHAARLLGAVSQSAGLPTGAVIERGSNANGEYVRFADGTQICTRTLTASASAATTWTFPAVFSAAPVLSGTAVAPVLSVLVCDTAPGTASASLSLRDKADARRADTVLLKAQGRWF